MDALSQLSYTPVTEQNELRVDWQTSIILTNIDMKFHCGGVIPVRQVRVENTTCRPSGASLSWLARFPTASAVGYGLPSLRDFRKQTILAAPNAGLTVMHDPLF